MLHIAAVAWRLVQFNANSTYNILFWCCFSLFFSLHCISLILPHSFLIRLNRNTDKYCLTDYYARWSMNIKWKCAISLKYCECVLIVAVVNCFHLACVDASLFLFLAVFLVPLLSSWIVLRFVKNVNGTRKWQRKLYKWLWVCVEYNTSMVIFILISFVALSSEWRGLTFCLSVNCVKNITQWNGVIAAISVLDWIHRIFWDECILYELWYSHRMKTSVVLVACNVCICVLDNPSSSKIQTPWVKIDTMNDGVFSYRTLGSLKQLYFLCLSCHSNCGISTFTDSIYSIGSKRDTFCSIREEKNEPDR